MIFCGSWKWLALRTCHGQHQGFRGLNFGGNCCYRYWPSWVVVILMFASPWYLLACNILNVWLFPLTYCVFFGILLHNLAVVLEVVSLAFYCVGSLVCCLPFTFGVSTNPMDTISQKLGRNLTGLKSLLKNKAFRYEVIA